MDRPSWWCLYATVLAYMMPTLAYYIAPTAEVEARRALAAPTPTGLHQYRREEDDPTYTVTYGAGSTCGYLSGSVQIPITCENKQRCLWELEYFRWIACEVEGQTTGIAHTKCLQREEALDPNLCGDVCVSNTYNLLCTNDTAPYCRTYAFPQGVRDYRCAPTPATRVSSADFTYDGQKHPNTTISTFRDVDATTSELVQSESLSATGIESAVASSTTTGSSSGGKGSSLNVGAIAGGVIGGSAALALIVCIYWSRRRQRQKNPTPSTGGPVELERVHQKHHSDLHAVTITSVADPPPARASRPNSPDVAPRPRFSSDQPEVVHELGDGDAQQH
ncbi:hypothetical protein FDECE_6992 [Fusarium decemcellulare]|nr:hypothetical protein FDECE_6992 [Fusarium decemcellulare]